MFTVAAPFPEEEFPFRIRFALTETVDEETHTVHFRLYRVNPYEWGFGEVLYHLPVLPSLHIWEAENGKGETKKWMPKLGEGDAVLSGFGDDMYLVEMTATLLS